MKTDCPRIERAEHSIEVPSPRNGKPGYRFVQGWVVRYSLHRASIPMRYREAQELLREERAKT